jgi:hypothetical protein
MKPVAPGRWLDGASLRLVEAHRQRPERKRGYDGLKTKLWTYRRAQSRLFVM